MNNSDYQKRLADKKTQESSGGNGLGFIAAAAGIKIAGIAGIKYRKEIGRGINKGIDKATTYVARSSYLEKAYEKSKNTLGAIGAANKGSYLPVAMQGKKFNNRYVREKETREIARKQKEKQGLAGRSLEAVDALGELRVAMNKAETLTFQAMRNERIEKELTKKFGDTFGGKIQAELNKNLSKNVSFLDKQNNEEVNNFVNKILDNLEKVPNKKEASDFDKQLKEILSDYKSPDSKGFKKEEDFQKKLLRQVEENKKRMVDSYVEKYSPISTKNKFQKDGTIKKVPRYSHEIGSRRERRYQRDFNAYNPTIDELLEEGALKNYGKIAVKPKNVNDLKETKAESYEEFKKYKNSQSLNRDNDINDFWKEVQQINKNIIQVKADKNLWRKTDTKELLDFRWLRDARREATDAFRRQTQIPLLNFNPLDLLHYTTWEGIRDAPKFGVRRIGQIDLAVQNRLKTTELMDEKNPNSVARRLSSHYMVLPNGEMMDFASGNIAAKGVYQVSAKYGPMQRQMAGMGNISGKGLDERGRIGKLFDFGRQENPSVFNLGISAITKFNNPHWGKNLVDSTRKGTDGGGLDPITGFKEIYDEFNRESKVLSNDMMNVISGDIRRAYGDININPEKLNTKEEIMDALGTLAKNIGDPTADIYRQVSPISKRETGISNLIMNTWRNYERQGEEFFKGGRIYSPKTALKPEFLSALDLQGTRVVNPLEDVKRLIHMHSIEQVQLKSSTKELSQMEEKIEKALSMGEISKKEVTDYKNLDVLSKLRDNWWDEVYTSGGEAELNSFVNILKNEESELTKNISNGLNQFNKATHAGPGIEPYDYFEGASYITMNKARGGEHLISKINESIIEGDSGIKGLAKGTWDVASQLFAGRRNLDNVTSLTSVPYVLTERLDNAIGQLGLGLSQEKRGSAFQIIANQFGRRIVLPYVALEQLKWADGLFGDNVSDTAAESYANMTIGMASVRDKLGLTRVFKEWSETFGGGDQISENPIGKVANALTLGFFGNKTEEETREWYESGETAIRKGRYWGIGSNTPFTGGKIDRYEANWYRKLKSDYQFTDTMYGSESEYWANSWIPTLTNPLSPIKKLIDPYHYERKHRYDRPYPVTGGFSELEQIPIIGAPLNNTVGRILKPRIEDRRLGREHEKYLEEINENTKEQYNGSRRGGTVSSTSLGQLTTSIDSSIVDDLMSDIDPDFLRQVGLDTGTAYEEEILGGVLKRQYNNASGNGNRMLYSGGVMEGSIVSSSGGTMYGSEGYSGVVGTPVMEGDNSYTGYGNMVVNQEFTPYSMDNVSKQTLTDMNNYMSDKAYGPSLGAGGKDTRGPVSLEDLRDPDVVEDLKDVGNLRDFNGGMRDLFYSGSEVAGIYGFSVKASTGFEESGRGMVLEESSRMTSYARAFWDKELGGLGGQLSEIGRRYVPRDPNKNYYNPIKNEMPDWLNKWSV